MDDGGAAVLGFGKIDLDLYALSRCIPSYILQTF